MGVKVTFEDKGLGALVGKFTDLDGMDLTVGVQGATGKKLVRGRNSLGRFTGSQISIATVAAINEFGTDTIPARPFVRSATFVHRESLAKVSAIAYAGFVSSKRRSAVDTLAEIGEFLAAKVKQRVDTSRQWAKPNAPSTVASKGFNRPLHDTGLLSRSISWAVRGPGGSIITEGPAR